MKGFTLTYENVKKAVNFLEKRKKHAKASSNREWEIEFDNAISVIKELSLMKV